MSAGRQRSASTVSACDGYTPFGDPGVEGELSLWLRARAWMSAESHRVLFARAAEHLIARRTLLPGYSTLWRLVGNAREHADARGFAMLADSPAANSASASRRCCAPRLAVGSPSSSASVFGLFEEAAALIFLYSLAEAIEELTFARTRSAIRDLLDLAPKQARRLVDGREQTVPAEQLAVGEVFLVRPGEALPTDGRIRDGRSTLNRGTAKIRLKRLTSPAARRRAGL